MLRFKLCTEGTDCSAFRDGAFHERTNEGSAPQLNDDQHLVVFSFSTSKCNYNCNGCDEFISPDELHTQHASCRRYSLKAEHDARRRYTYSCTHMALSTSTAVPPKR